MRFDRAGDREDLSRIGNVAQNIPRVKHESSFRQMLRDEIERLARETANPDWGCENESSIAKADWEWASSFLAQASSRGLPEPTVAPCGDGSVHLTWFRQRDRIVIEHKGQLTFFSSAVEETYETGPLSSDEIALDRVVNFML